MKKILFMLLAATTLFSSCSSADDTINNGGDNNTPDTKKYTVNLNVKSAGFEVDKTPLKDFSSYGAILQIVVYKSSGEVYSDSIIDNATLKSLIAKNDTPQISLELPEDDYFLSILNVNRVSESFYPTINDIKIIPNNYETDYYEPRSGNNSFIASNSNVYYYTSKLNVSSQNSNTTNIVLDPMWSRVTKIDVKKSETFKYPVGADFDIYQISPRYYGFGIKSKLAKTLDPTIFKEFQWYDTSLSMSGLHHANELPVIVSKSEDKIIYLDVCYLKRDNHSGAYITKIQRIKLSVEIENGQNYTISGTIPDVDSIDQEMLHISLKPFKDSNISFQ